MFMIEWWGVHNSTAVHCHYYVHVLHVQSLVTLTHTSNASISVLSHYAMLVGYIPE